MYIGMQKCRMTGPLLTGPPRRYGKYRVYRLPGSEMVTQVIGQYQRMVMDRVFSRI